jgi:DNA-binding MarR family transcriptional regulator
MAEVELGKRSVKMPKRQPKPEAPPMIIPADEAPPCLYLRLRLASRRLLSLYEAHLAASGVSMSQFGLLAGIAEAPELTMSRLAELRELSPSTLTRTLRPMEAAGWVEVFAEGRERRLRLTRQGRARLKAAYAGWKQAQTEAVEAVSPRDVARVLRATEKLPL